MDNYINNAMLENEKELNGGAYQHQFMLSKIKGGAKPAVATTDTKILKKVMDFQRRAVRDMESDIKPVGIKEGVDRYKFEKKFSNFVNSINSQIELYLSGELGNDTGNVLIIYNDLVLYLKNILNYTKLSEREKENIKTEFNNILPQITQLMDIAISQDYVDTRHIEEVYNNIVNQNYKQVKTPDYKKQIEEKKPYYIEAQEYDDNINDYIIQVTDYLDRGIYEDNDDNGYRLERLNEIEEEMGNLTDELVGDLNPNQIKKIQINLKKLRTEVGRINFDETRSGSKVLKVEEKQARIKEEKEALAQRGIIDKKKQEEIMTGQLQFVLKNGREKDIINFKTASRGQQSLIVDKIKTRIEKEAEKTVTKELERRQAKEDIDYDVEADRLRREAEIKRFAFLKRRTDKLKAIDDLDTFEESKRERDQIKKDMDAVIKKDMDAVIKKEAVGVAKKERKERIERDLARDLARDIAKKAKDDEKLYKDYIEDQTKKMRVDDYLRNQTVKFKPPSKKKQIKAINAAKKYTADQEDIEDKQELAERKYELAQRKSIKDAEKKIKADQKHKPKPRASPAIGPPVFNPFSPLSAAEYVASPSSRPIPAEIAAATKKRIMDEVAREQIPRQPINQIPRHPIKPIPMTGKYKAFQKYQADQKYKPKPPASQPLMPDNPTPAELDFILARQQNPRGRLFSIPDEPTRAELAALERERFYTALDRERLAPERERFYTALDRERLAREARLQNPKGKGKKKVIKKLKSNELFELFKKLQKPKPKGRGMGKSLINTVVEVVKRGRGRPRKITVAEIETPSQVFYDKLTQLNRDKMYGTGKYIANAVRRTVPDFSSNDIQPMPSSFIDHFEKVVKLSKKN